MNSFNANRKSATLAVVATLMILSFGGALSAWARESAGDYIDDSVITTKVKAAILAEPKLKSTEVNVETYKGVVQLSGFVANPADIGKAGEVARGVNGVKSVKNDLHVK